MNSAQNSPPPPVVRRILIAGGSGLLGRALVASWEKQGREVVRLVRRPARGPRELEWDPAALKATNVPEADKYIRHQYREGWTI